MNPQHPTNAGSQDAQASSRAQGRTDAAPDQSSASEPWAEDQVDIAGRVQEGLKQANEHERDTTHERTDTGGSSVMDGNPAPQGDTEGGLFKPADDTPAVLPKRSGPAQ